MFSLCTLQQCVHMYSHGPDMQRGVAGIIAPAALALIYYRLRSTYPDVLRAYALTFYDESSHRLRVVGACGAAWTALLALPMPLMSIPDPQQLEIANIDAAVAALRLSQNSFITPWARTAPGISCILVKKTELSTASAELSRLPGVKTGQFSRR